MQSEAGRFVEDPTGYILSLILLVTNQCSGLWSGKGYVENQDICLMSPLFFHNHHLILHL